MPSQRASASGSVLLKDPGLTPNGPDGMSCVLACVQMVMRTKPEGRVFSFDEMNTILRRKTGLYTWPYAINEAIVREGFQIEFHGMFDNARFVNEGKNYFLEYFGPEAGQVMIDNTDIPIVREDAGRFINCPGIKCEKRVPSLEDIRTRLRNGWYAMPTVNSRILRSMEGYSAHLVFVFGFDDETITINDPGSPPKHYAPQAGQKISWELFEKAWASPSEKARVIYFYRPMSNEKVTHHA